MNEEKKHQKLNLSNKEGDTVKNLLGLLRKVWRKRQAEVQDRWNRTLPFADYISDRWEKAKLLGFGEGTSVYDSVLVFGNPKVGGNTWIGPFVILDGSGCLEIGSHCTISAGTQIYSHDNVNRTLSSGREPISYSRTTIGDNCYIGPNVIISRGVTIGDGCIVGANSFVNKDIPPHSKAWGTPASIIEHTQ